MQEAIIKDNTKIENLIYEIREKQVMLDSEISRIKCHNYFYDIMITHYNVDKSISVFNNYAGIIYII